jgi:hypothetical protein
MYALGQASLRMRGGRAADRLSVCDLERPERRDAVRALWSVVRPAGSPRADEQQHEEDRYDRREDPDRDPHTGSTAERRGGFRGLAGLFLRRMLLGVLDADDGAERAHDRRLPVLSSLIAASAPRRLRAAIELRVFSSRR